MATCSTITCNESVIDFRTLMMMNLSEFSEFGLRLPAVKIRIETTDDSQFVTCNNTNLSIEQLLKLTLTSDKYVRVTSVGYTHRVTCSTIKDVLTLLRMSITKSTDGCATIRIVDNDDRNSVVACNRINPKDIQFYISDDGTKAAVSVSNIGGDGGEYASCDYPIDNENALYLLLSVLDSNGNPIIPVIEY